MKKTPLLPLIIVFLLVLTLSSCSQPTPIASCYLLGAHDNFPAFTPAILTDDVHEACRSYGSLSAVVIDGDPYAVFDGTLTAPTEFQDDAWHEHNAKSNTEAVLQMMDEAQAQTPEVDTLGAIGLAADILAMKTEPVKRLVIVDSMLSTADLLDFASVNLLDQEPAAIVEQLNERHAIPNLTGVDVVILGLGQTAGEQTELTPDAIFRLRAIWEAILEAADARSVTVRTTPIGNADPEDLPSVSLVHIVSNPLDFVQPIREETPTVTVLAEAPSETAAETVPAPSPEPTLPGTVIRFDEQSVRFLGDQAVFADEELAWSTLTPIADVLNAHPGTEVVLAGMTASFGDSAACRSLSLRRAEAVKAVLVSRNVPEASIATVGLGRDDCFLRVPDLDASGNLTADAAKNRAVFLFLRNSDTADKLGIQ